MSEPGRGATSRSRGGPGARGGPQLPRPARARCGRPARRQTPCKGRPARTATRTLAGSAAARTFATTASAGLCWLAACSTRAARRATAVSPAAAVVCTRSVPAPTFSVPACTASPAPRTTGADSPAGRAWEARGTAQAQRLRRWRPAPPRCQRAPLAALLEAAGVLASPGRPCRRACEDRLVQRAAAFHHLAVKRHRVPGGHKHCGAHWHLLHRHASARGGQHGCGRAGPGRGQPGGE